MSNTSSLLARDKFKDKFDLLLDEHLPSTCPAMSVCAIHRGETVLQAARGWIDPDTRQLSVQTDTLFDLASVTKIIVETSFLVLVQAGKVRLESNLADVIREFAAINPREISGGQDPHTREFLSIDSEYSGSSVDVSQVTFKHLLTHSSGLPPWRAVYLLAGEDAPKPPTPGHRYEEERWHNGLAAMLGFPFVGPVADTVRYTDIGIMLLGEAVARLHGARLDRAISDLVLNPLDLGSFTYNPVKNGVSMNKIVPTEIDSSWRKRRVWGEVHDENACGVGGIAGHAGLFATATDVARFGQAWFSGDSRLKVGKQLRETATQLQAQGQFRMGLGWMLKAAEDSSSGDLYHASSYGHTGFTGTSLWIDPHQQLVTALLTNRVYHGRHAENIHAFRRALHDLIAQGIRHG